MPLTVLDATAAVSLIPNDCNVAISGGGYRVVPESLLEALANRFRQEGSPRDLTLVAIAMVERGRGGKGGMGTGLNRLAVEGLTRRVITSSFSRSSAHELNVGIHANLFATYNLPMGTLVQLLRATAAGRKGFATPVGIGTFVDPRLGGGRVNAAAKEDICRIEELAGEAVLYYPRLPIDVALIKASAADERGNLFFDREAFDHGTIELAMAAHQCGGKVIAEVNRIVPVGEIHPRMGRIPGAIVDAIVVQPETWEDEQAPHHNGGQRAIIPPPAPRNLPRDLIARIAVSRLRPGAMVNLGAGLPMYDVPEASRAMGRTDLYFTIEQGPMGGWPQVGGVSRNPELILDQNEVFQFYEGGGPDVSILSFGEVDRNGHVNVSRFAGMLPGCGGFINIVHGIDHLMFCGTLTTGGLAETVHAGGLTIETEGRIDRFVEKVEQITFNGQMGLEVGKRAEYITDRGTFVLAREGMVLTHIAPGIDLERDILAHIPFAIEIDPALQLLPKELFAAAGVVPSEAAGEASAATAA